MQEHWSGLPFPSPMHESEKWKWSHSVVWLFATPWTAAYQAPQSMGFSKLDYWSGLPLPSPAKDEPWAMIQSQGQQPACPRNGHVNSVWSQMSLDLQKGKIGHNNPACDMIWPFYTASISILENLSSQFFTSSSGLLYHKWCCWGEDRWGGCYFSSVYLIDSGRNMYYFLQNFFF